MEHQKMASTNNDLLKDINERLNDFSKQLDSLQKDIKNIRRSVVSEKKIHFEKDILFVEYEEPIKESSWWFS